MTHRLTPMFECRSMAVVGASARAGSFGHRLAQSVLSAGFEGDLSFIHPRGDLIQGRASLTNLNELEAAPDVVVIGIGGAKQEQVLQEAIDIGARSVVMFDACSGAAYDGTPLLQRMRDMAAEANLPICGGNGMGFVVSGTGAVASFYPADRIKPGGISLIAHSGSVFTTLAMNDPRYRFDLVASPGQEIGATLDEYIDYAASRETTRAIALFMEGARNPDGMIAALKSARDRGVPVVVCKVGRTEESARLARSHTGALAGSNVAYEAVFEECGAISVSSVDALMNTALLCASGRVPGLGGVGLVTDSGGLREMQVDMAEESGTRLAKLSPETRAKLREALPPELEPSIPLDCAADLNDDFPKVFDRGLQILAEAPEVSMLGFEADMRDDYIYHDEVFEHARTLLHRSDKPSFFYASSGQTHNRELGAELAELGVPVLNGAANMLEAVRNFQSWADRQRQGMAPPPRSAPDGVVEKWRGRLAAPMDEHSSLALLSDFAVPSVQSTICNTLQEVLIASELVGFPLVMKTAEQGMDHKSDVNGVLLNLEDDAAVKAGYADLSQRLGHRVIVQPMAQSGIELAFGCVKDPDFGPIVMVAPGGKLVELFDERQFARAPISRDKAEAMIRQLSVARLIDGVRGDAPQDLQAAAVAFARFSQMCAALEQDIAEVDVNPVVVTEGGALAVDALVVPAAQATSEAAE